MIGLLNNKTTMRIYKILNYYVASAKINGKKFYYKGNTRLEVINYIIRAYELAI